MTVKRLSYLLGVTILFTSGYDSQPSVSQVSTAGDAPSAPIVTPPVPKVLTASQKKALAKKEHDDELARKHQARIEEAERAKEAKRLAAEEAAAARQADLDAYARIKAKAAHDWPNDYSEQKFIYDQQVEAYEYMKTIPDSSLKAKVQADWPDDYNEQKFIYDQNMQDKAKLDSSP